MYKNLSKFSTAPHSHSTRHANEPVISYQRLTLSRYRLEYSGPKFWRGLPGDIKTATSLPLFKVTLKKYLLLQYNSS